MKAGASAPFGAHLKALREAAGYTQEELATIAGLSVHAVSALERGQRHKPHVETLRALSGALHLTGASRDAFVAWSDQLLDSNEQRAFRSLGALPGRFPIEAAAAVARG